MSSKLWTSLIPTKQKHYNGAIVKGYSDMKCILSLPDYFDFIILSKDDRVQKPNEHVSNAAIEEFMVQLMEDEQRVECFLMGEEAISFNEDTATYGFVKSTEFTLNTSWKALEHKAVDAFANAVSLWRVHVDDD